MRNQFLLPILSVSLVSLFGIADGVVADTLDSILVEDSIDINPNKAEPDSYNRSRATSSDGGEFLAQINGVSVSRFGGRGLEPVIRGQSQTRLNILLDGSYVHGGCPNRMDPPASWAALETYENVNVLKGVQTLTQGGGGSGGTVLFERDTRSLAEDKGVHGRVGVMGSSNQIQHDINADIVAASEKAYIRGIAEDKKAKNYKDGNGKDVRSAFNHQQAGVIIGFMPTADRLLEFSHEYNHFTDALYPGAGMDSPEEKGNITRLRYLDRPNSDGVDEVKFELYRSDIDHLMDNFSLRAFNPSKKMQTPTTSLTTGGRLSLKSSINNTQIEYGIDLQKNTRNAVLNNMNTGTARSVSLMWPDIRIKQTGVFAEATSKLGKKQTLKYGIRLDKVDVNYGKANTASQLTGRTANQSYQAYYGTTAHNKTENNIAAMLRYEKQISPDTQIFTGLSHTVRTADATERGINKWLADATQRWVGNPDVKPEKHNQLDVGITKVTDKYSANASVYFDKVNDYILRDGARGQAGVLRSDNADIYRNIDAELYGLEAEAKIKLNNKLDLSTSLATVHASNISDKRPIAQTPPLNGNVQLDYKQSKWGIGTRLRFAAKQSRVDTLSKQEVGESAGYAVVDFYGNAKLNKSLKLRYGIDNLFNKNYANHINRSNLLDNNATGVNEAGRTAWLKLITEF